jgi:hypothetical protein
MAEDPGEDLLARDIVDVHGAEAVTIVQANARAASVGGQPAKPKSWIRVPACPASSDRYTLGASAPLIAIKLNEDHRNVHFLRR